MRNYIKEELKASDELKKSVYDSSVIGKIKQRDIKKFWKLANVSKNTDKDAINDTVLHYIYTMDSKKYSKIVLTKEQRHDKKFMKALYLFNAEMTELFLPTTEQMEDDDFMAIYAKQNYDFYRAKINYRGRIIDHAVLTEVLKKCGRQVLNSEFITKLCKELPNLNVVEVVTNYITNYGTFKKNGKYTMESYVPALYIDCEESNSEEYIKNLIAKLPPVLLEDLKNKFGEGVWSKIEEITDENEK